MELLIATANPAKVREFREMLDDGHFNWRDLAQIGASQPVAETGHTFRANACLKASVYGRRHRMWTLADDSGLEVDALHGKPGVYGARWAELNKTGRGDRDNNATLLQQLASVSDDQRTGRFVCVLALSDPEGQTVLTARDTVEGMVIRAPRGTNGFGYDPLFYVKELGRTTAELPSDEKHCISHRGKALRRLRGLMDQIDLEALSNAVIAR